MKNLKKLYYPLLLLLMVYVLSACGNNEQKIAEPGKVDQTQSSKVTLTDVIGQEVTLESPAKKVVGTHNPSLNAVVVLGGGQKYLVGFGNKEMSRGLYSRVMDDYDGLTQIGKGSNINYETVASLDPDLAVLPERFKDQVAEFGKIGVPAIVALPNTESFDTVKSSLTLIAKALGEDDRAQEIIQFFDTKLRQATEVSGKATEKPSVLFLGGSSALSVAPKAMIQTQLIEAAGGVNAVSGLDVTGDFAAVNIEQITAWNPDVIWYPAYANYTAEDLYNDPAWSGINAVINKRVYAFPSALEPWDQPTAAVTLGVCWATHNLHPDLYTKEDLMKDADEFYNLVYGKTFTAEELGIQ